MIFKRISVQVFLVVFLLAIIFYLGFSLYQERAENMAIEEGAAESVQRLSPEEIDDTFAENKRLAEENAALTDPDKAIVNSYMREIIKALYAADGKSYVQKIMSIREILSEEMYDRLTSDIDGEEYNDGGVRTSVEIRKIYTNRPSGTSMEALAVCRYTDSSSDDLYTLLIGMDFSFENDQWIMVRIPLEKYIYGYQDEYY